MKRCPVCQRVYEDEMGYCLEDGSGLMNISNASSDANATVRIPASRLTEQPPTKVLQAGTAATQPAPQYARQHYASERTVPAERKSSALPWIIGALILGISGIAIALIMTRNREPDNSQISQDQSQVANTSPTLGTSNTAIFNPTGNPSTASAPTSNVASNIPADRTSAQASPTPKLTPTPKGTTLSVVPEEPPPPPPAPPSSERKTISGGVLNGKANSLPKPVYPAIARAAHASGTVIVQVTIDESGKVASARAVGGHPLLQQAAVQAAYGARFSPTLLSGQPVKVTGVITYNFVAQ
jgi:TonB family protein